MEMLGKTLIAGANVVPATLANASEMLSGAIWDERRRIAAAGRKRCLRDGYANDDRIRSMLAIVTGACSPSASLETQGRVRHATRA